MSEKGSPEIRCCKMTRELFLNPGLPKAPPKVSRQNERKQKRAKV